MKTLRFVIAALFLGAVLGLTMSLVRAPEVSAHCQIPCGIYNDPVRFTMLEEHITTIEKSMNSITELSEDPAKNANQLIRWTMNKEDHADKLAEIVVQYFLQQRIKPVASTEGEDGRKYLEKLRLCHEILVASMKAKQTTDLQYVEQLKSLVADFRTAYFAAGGEKTVHEHTGQEPHSH